MMRVLTCIAWEHDLRMLPPALLVCGLGSAATAQLFFRMPATSGPGRLGWTLLTALATGSMIWSTHFVAMLAFDAKAPVSLDPLLTFVSLQIAVLVAAPGLLLAAARSSRVLTVLGGGIVGGAVAAMHYSGAVKPTWQSWSEAGSRAGVPRPSRAKPPSPFLRFNSSPEVIRLVVLMYVRFPLSLRNVEDLLFERGIDICHETVRLWWNRFGPMFAGDIRRQRVSRMRGFRHWRWQLDEMYVKLNGEMVYLWRAADHEGEVLESYVTRARDKTAALRFMKRALKRHGSPDTITTDGLRSYGAALDELGCRERQEVGRWANNPVENSHLPFRRRERAMARFRRMSSLQKFASVHASLHNHFSLERHLTDRQTYKERRSAAWAEWGLLAS